MGRKFFVAKVNLREQKAGLPCCARCSSRSRKFMLPMQLGMERRRIGASGLDRRADQEWSREESSNYRTVKLAANESAPVHQAQVQGVLARPCMTPQLRGGLQSGVHRVFLGHELV